MLPAQTSLVLRETFPGDIPACSQEPHEPVWLLRRPLLCSVKLPMGKICKGVWLPPAPLLWGFSWEDVSCLFQGCPRLQGRALPRLREAVPGISMHSSTWMQHKHPKRFQWILFRLIKNTNQACMYYLIYINIYSIYKTNASGQRLSLWHKL